MKLFLLAFIVIIFLVIALFHFYWANGGKYGFDKVLPTSSVGEKIMQPSNGMTIMVGVIFLMMIGFLILRYQQNSLFFPNWLFENGIEILAAIFLLRAIGDFKYAGFFKSIKGTPFAKNDSLYFSPLCLLISILLIGFERYS